MGLEYSQRSSNFPPQVSLIGLGGSSRSHSTILHLAELVSKKEGNCNNVTFGAKSSQSRSDVITIIQDFILVTFTSTIIPNPVRLPLKVAVPSHPMYLTTYILNSSLPTKSKGVFGCENYFCFVYLSKNKVIITQASLDSVEFERMVGCNQTCFSLVQMSVLLSVLNIVTR